MDIYYGLPIKELPKFLTPKIYSLKNVSDNLSEHSALATVNEGILLIYKFYYC